MNLTGRPGILISIDFEKAFDNIRWEFIFGALQAFGFGECYISWVKLIYEDIVACVINNGFTSQWFKLSRGTRQGCCLSPFLFVIAVELLAHNVRMNRSILGIKVVKREIKISQFADDTTCFLESVPSLLHLLDCLERFRRYAGLKVNRYKTQCLTIGEIDVSHARIEGITWCNELKILGVVLGKNLKEEQHYLLNYKSRIDKIRNICLDWKNRNISLKGKITLINAIMIPTIMYPAMVTAVPKNALSELNNIIYKFLWNSNHNKIAKSTMCAQVKHGGLALADFETKVIASNLNWIKRLYLTENSIPSIFIEYLLDRDIGIKTFIGMKTDIIIQQQKSPFYNKMFQDWHNVYNQSLITEPEVRNKILLGNVFITSARKSLWWQSWIDAGILKVQDILDGDSFMSEKQIADKYGVKCNFLQALQIHKCMPGRWRESITNNGAQPEGDCLYIMNSVPQAVNILDIRSRELNWIIRDQSSPKLTGQIRWYQMYPTLGIMNATWTSLYTYPFRIIRETKLQSFQFKVFHRIITCNSYLKNIRIKDSSECEYCDGQKDTMVHFFVTCPVVVHFWKSIFRWLNTIMKIDTSRITESEQILGVYQKMKDCDTINMVLLRARFYIYRQRLFPKCALDIMQWLKELKHALLFEEYICKMENKVKKFKKWQQLLDVL